MYRITLFDSLKSFIDFRKLREKLPMPFYGKVNQRKVLVCSSSNLLITGKIIKFQIHSKLYILPQSYLPLRAEDELTQVRYSNIRPLVLNIYITVELQWLEH